MVSDELLARVERLEREYRSLKRWGVAVMLFNLGFAYLSVDAWTHGQFVSVGPVSLLALFLTLVVVGLLLSVRSRYLRGEAR